MEKQKWTLINAENVVPYVCSESYSSKQLTGNEIAGLPVININEGTLIGHSRTEGGAHEETEIYYIIEGNAILWLDDDSIPVKPGDIIVIPPHTWHWIDNTMNDNIFKIFTFWPTETQNGVFFARKKEWGTTIKVFDEEYQEKRLA